MEPMQLKQGDVVRLRAPSGRGLNAAVALVSDNRKSLALVVLSGDEIGAVPLSWIEDHYEDMRGRCIGVELPVYVRATLKRVKTEDGIMSVEESLLGKVYRVQLNSMEMTEWGHVDHPGRRWERMSAVFVDADGHQGHFPIELFEIETN